jgi:hypothetical protein
MTNGWLDFIFLQNGFDSKLVYQKQHFWFVWGLELDNSKTIWGQCLFKIDWSKYVNYVSTKYVKTDNFREILKVSNKY